MVKQRFSTCDVAAEIGCLKDRVVGMRLANVYDMNAKAYLLKLARSGDDGDKIFLVLESGSRFHTTKWSKDKAETPSNFTLKLRKHLRTRRLEDVRQLGVDRIVDFSFGSGEGRCHLILELFSQGNLILTDAKYEILTLLRSYRDDAKGVAIMARHPYPLQTVRLHQPVTAAKLLEALASTDEKATLRSAVIQVLPFGSALADHTVLASGLQPQTPLKNARLSEEQVDRLRAAVQSSEQIIADYSARAPKGFIWQTTQSGKNKGPKQPHSAASKEDGPLVYNDFDAVPLEQCRGQTVLEFETFDAALDEFFAKVEGQRAEQAQIRQENAVLSKVENIRMDQTKRAQALEDEAKQEELKATLIEYNLEAVDGAIAAVRGALAGGLNWKELKRLIKAERDAGNPVAALIHSLELEQNRISLLLSNFLDDEEGDDDAITRPATKVEIDLDLNAYSNARVHFESRKAKAAKQLKTLEQNEKALKAAEKTAQHKLTQVKSAKTVQQLRKAYWFEKFHWFVTSENFLVVSGRDMQQNELIVKRYLRRGDIYVHAELHGASTTIVKNHNPDLPVPPMSVAQAGCACVCRSKAWDAKMVTSAWWVHHDQVSKTAPTGEYLPTGSFIIRGKKNFLPPQPLIMGLSFLFRLDESSLAGHVGERAVRGANGDASMQPEPIETEGGSDNDVAEAASEADGGSEAPNSALDAFMEGSADLVSLSHQRYGLPEPGEAMTGEPEAEEVLSADAHSADQQRRHLSAHERKLAKKPTRDGPDAAPEAATALAEARKAERARREAKQQADLQAKSEAAAAAVRGKRGKVKKAQAKYAHQDEEDRQLALQLLDPAGKKRGKNERKEVRKARKQDVAGNSSGLPRLPPTTEELARVGALTDTRRPVRGTEKQEDDRDASKAAAPLGDVSLPSSSAEIDVSSANGHAALTPAELHSKSRSPATPEAAGIQATALFSTENGSQSTAAEVHQKSQQEGAGADGESDVDLERDPGQSEGAAERDALDAEREEAEITELLEEEQVELLPEAELARLREIDALTGQPRVGDILLHAVPVCAPYSALQSYKYRIKLTPGTQRKGKAGRQAIELLLRGADLPAREKELMKGVPEMEVINAMIGAVKISMAGLQKIKNEARSQKKKNKASS